MNTLIYSNFKIEGLDGLYQDPKYFNGNIVKDVELVYTDKEEIKKAYESIDIEVKPLNEHEITNCWVYPENATDNITHWAYPKELLTQKGKLSGHKKAEIELFNKKFADDVAQGTILEDEAWEELYPNDDIELFRITKEVI